MANIRVQSLIVLTLFQLCLSQAPNNKSESWYLANVINDGFQPKPITEIFSTRSPFYTTETSQPSTLPPPSSFQYTITYVQSPLPTSTPLTNNGGSTLSTVNGFISRLPSQDKTTQFIEQTKTTLQSRLDFEPEQTTVSTLTSEQQTETAQLTQSSIAGRFLIPVENVSELQPMRQQLASLPTPELTGSFVFYQNDAFQNGPRQEPSLEGGLFGNRVPPQVDSSREPSSTVTFQPTSTVFSSSTPTYREPTATVPTVETVRTSARTSLGPTPVPVSEQTTRRMPNDLLNSNQNYLNRTQVNSFGTLPLRIRVVGPRGAITNVNINPRVVVVPTTTTKRPTTTRTRKTPKPKRNTYDACLNGCKARRDPICAIPLSATWIDPEKLKGFPSVCHMACYNSYKKDPYEKLLDGRCGRLRTRIHTFDSNTKLKREELNKAQYFLDNGDQTVVEVSPLYKK